MLVVLDYIFSLAPFSDPQNHGNLKLNLVKKPNKCCTYNYFSTEACVLGWEPIQQGESCKQYWLCTLLWQCILTSWEMPPSGDVWEGVLKYDNIGVCEKKVSKSCSLIKVSVSVRSSLMSPDIQCFVNHFDFWQWRVFTVSYKCKLCAYV